GVTEDGGHEGIGELGTVLAYLAVGTIGITFAEYLIGIVGGAFVGGAAVVKEWRLMNDAAELEKALQADKDDALKKVQFILLSPFVAGFKFGFNWVVRAAFSGIPNATKGLDPGLIPLLSNPVPILDQSNQVVSDVSVSGVTASGTMSGGARSPGLTISG